MAQGILVFIEQRNGQVRKASLEALSEAYRQSKSVGGVVSAVVIGDNVQSIVPDLSHYKAAKAYTVEGADFAQYSTEAYAAGLAAAIKQADPRYVVAANTAMAKDLLPRVAARFDAPMVSDVMKIEAQGDKLIASRAMYSGKTMGSFDLKSDLSFLTLRPNVFPLLESTNNNTAAVEPLSVTPDKVRARVTETKAAEGQKVELSEASIIVSGGRGIKGPENWPVLQNLCDALGAALGASRAVVDAGWIDHQHQVGQTGKTVSPQLYIACGISGAIQHLAGMSSSKVIVAINKDPEAPIFKHATYGLVGDVLEIVPKLAEEVRKAQENN